MTSTETKVPKSKSVDNAGTYTLNSNFTEQPKKKFSFSKLVKSVLEIPSNAFCKVNWYYPNGRKQFPNEPRMWTVDRYYPHAEPPILCDFVVLPYKRKEAKRKHEYFKNMGVHYVALDRNAAIIDFETETLIEEKKSK